MSEKQPTNEALPIGFVESIFHEAVNLVMEKDSITMIRVELRGTCFSFSPVKITNGSMGEALQLPAVHSFMDSIRDQMSDYDCTKAISIEDSQTGVVIEVDYAKISKRVPH